MAESNSELTVEQALAELREMFPQTRMIFIEAQISCWRDTDGDKVNTTARICIGQHCLDGQSVAPTLSEAMQQVRTWRKETRK